MDPTLPSFQYNSADAATGVVDAPDRAAAVRTLLARGVTPVKVEPLTLSAAPRGGAGSAGGAAGGLTVEKRSSDAGRAGAAPTAVSGVRRSSMSLPETASFVRELATAIQAGLPMVPALRTLAKSGRSPGQRAMLGHLIAEVEQGKTLADAARTWGKPFNDLIINLMRAGEASGKLGDVLHQAADLLDKDLALRRSVLAATLYPMILTVLVGGAVAVMTTVIVPRVLGPLKGQFKSLPLPTRMVQGSADFMAAYWWVLALLAGAAVLAWVRARATPGPRETIDRALLRLPLFGPVLRDAAVARFTRTLGTLVQAGLPVLQALRLTGATLTNHAMRNAVTRVCDQVQSGRTIAEPLEREGLFPPLLVQIVSLGERSGRLPELLKQAAGSLDSRTETRVKVITSVLPPLLIVVLAVVVGFVVAAIILPLLEMQQAIG